MSYAIIWPTIWPYIGTFSVEKWQKDVLYGTTYIAYPIASMVSAFLIMKCAPHGFSFRLVLFILNSFEILGNLIYALPFHPVMPLLGRFIAGFGDVFYLLLAKEIAVAFVEREAEIITMQCLSSFVVGVVFAPCLSLATGTVNTSWNEWPINLYTMPGISMAALFLLMQFVVLIFLKDLVAPYERCTRSTSDFGEGDLPVSKLSKASRNSESSVSVDRSCSSMYSIFVLTFAFIYGFSVGTFELILPIVYWEKYPGQFLGVGAVYAFLATLYAIFLIVTVITSVRCKPKIIVPVAILVSVIGQGATLYMKHGEWGGSVLATEVLISLSLAVLWAIDDVLFIDIVTFMVPHNVQDETHKWRRAVSKIAFAASGIIVPLAYNKLGIIAPTFIVANVLVYIFFLVAGYQITGAIF